jgi:hypothetical protein
VHCALSKLVWPHVGQMKSSIGFSRIVDGTQAGFGVGPFLPRDRADQTHPTATAATLVASRWISWAASAIFTRLGVMSPAATRRCGIVLLAALFGLS